MPNPRLLIIDDDRDSSSQLRELGQASGFEVDVADDYGELDRFLARAPRVAVVNLDLGSGDGERTGFNLLEAADFDSVDEVFLVTRSPDYRSASRGMRLGASDYFHVPDDSDRLSEALERLSHSAEGAAGDDDRLMVGRSPPMQRLYRLIGKVAPTDVTVFFVGESGSGKELAAQEIHRLSPRRDGPFVPVNCGAVASELIESELFGHEKGAFTGAAKRHQGFFERANGGTLFLDEVTETSPDLQVKLLRVLETGQFRRVGGTKEHSADVRVVASTNRDAEEAVSKGILREDLYYRLAQFPIRMPALRERGDDVLLLAEHFLARLNEEHGVDKRLSEETRDVLRLHDWPGNVRELRNAMARAHILAEGTIDTDDLPGNIPSSAEPRGDYLRITVGHSLADVERRVILATLEHFDGDKKQAAKTLGVSVKTIYNRLKQYDVDL